MEYTPNTRDQIGHYFSNKVGTLRYLRLEGIVDDEKVHEFQRAFIEGIEATITSLAEGKLLESEGIGETQLRRILELARSSDWAQVETIRALYQVYDGITGQKSDVEIV
ncbi:hypothetical protein KY343_02195 [Candidatus Woesearchaeota archaeon]|nr:hypothetical protein [Candidatus Woesearchaeota archaeon]